MLLTPFVSGLLGWRRGEGLLLANAQVGFHLTSEQGHLEKYSYEIPESDYASYLLSRRA